MNIWRNEVIFAPVQHLDIQRREKIEIDSADLIYYEYIMSNFQNYCTMNCQLNKKACFISGMGIASDEIDFSMKFCTHKPELEYFLQLLPGRHFLLFL